MNDNNLVLTGTLYAAGTRGYSAYEIAVQQGFVGDEDAWLASIVGETGPEGPEGPIGNPGPTGATPSIRVGTVTTVQPTTPASVSITGTPEVPILNFNIPQGVKGEAGSTDYSTLDNRPYINNVLLNGNLSLDTLGIQPKGDYANSSDIPDVSNFVSFNDYAQSNKGGVVKLANGFNLSSGLTMCDTKTYSDYNNANNTLFIGKGTLENVITGKDLTTKAYVDGLVGDINSALDALNGEVI